MDRNNNKNNLGKKIGIYSRCRSLTLSKSDVQLHHKKLEKWYGVKIVTQI